MSSSSSNGIRAISSARLSRPSNSKQVSSSTKLFDEVADNSHLINQLLAELEPEQLTHLKDSIDKHENGRVDVHEFVDCVRGAIEMGIMTGKEQVLMARSLDLFSQLDVDCDSYINWDDFCSGVVETHNRRKNAIQLYKSEPVFPDFQLEEESERILYIKGAGQVLVSGKNKTSYIVNPSDGSLISPVTGHSGAILSAVHVPLTGAVYTSSADRSIMAWNSENWSEPLRAIGTQYPQMCMTYLGEAHNNLLVTGSTEGIIRSWDPHRLSEQKWKIENAASDWIMDLCLIPEISTVVSGSLDRSIKLWDIRTGTLKAERVGHSKGVLSLAYNNAYRFMISASSSREVFIWNPFTPGIIQKLPGHEKPVGVYSFDDSPEIITVDQSGKIMIWDIRVFQCVQTLEGDKEPGVGPIHSFCVDPDRRQILTTGDDIAVFKCEDQQEKGVLNRSASSIQYSSIFRLLAVTCKADIFVWRANTGKLQSHYGHMSDCDISCALLSPNGRDIFIGNLEGRIKLVSLLNGQVQQDFNLVDDEIREMIHISSFVKKTKASGVPLSKSGSFIVPSKTSSSSASAAALSSSSSSNGRYLLVITTSGQVVVLNWATKGSESVVQQFSSSLGEVDFFAFAPDAKQVALCNDTKLEIWDIETGSLKEETETDYRVTAMLYIEEFNVLALGDAIGDVHFLSLPNYYEIAVLHHEANLGNHPLSSPVRSPPPGKDQHDIPDIIGSPSASASASAPSSSSLSAAALSVANDIPPSPVRYLFRNQFTIVITSDCYIRVCGLTDLMAKCYDRAEIRNAYIPPTGSVVLYDRFALVDGAEVQGGLNAVRFALDIKNHGRRTALKFTDNQEEFYAEVACMQACNGCEYVCGMYSYYDASEYPAGDGGEEEEPLCCIAFEFGDAVLYDRVRSPGFRSSECRFIIECMARCLQDLHSRGFISSDFKSKNMLLFGDVWKIIDLDNSRRFGEEMPLKYSPNYCAPEMARYKLGLTDRLLADSNFDMWGFGATVYEVCTNGQLLFQGMSEYEIIRILSTRSEVDLQLNNISDPHFRHVASMCLKKNPAQRWSAKEVLLYLSDVGYLLGRKPKAAQFKPFPRVISDSQTRIDRMPMNAATIQAWKATKTPIRKMRTASDTGGSSAASAPSSNLIFTSEFDGKRCWVKLHTPDGRCIGEVPHRDGRQAVPWNFPSDDRFKTLKSTSSLFGNRTASMQAFGKAKNLFNRSKSPDPADAEGGFKSPPPGSINSSGIAASGGDGGFGGSGAKKSFGLLKRAAEIVIASNAESSAASPPPSSPSSNLQPRAVSFQPDVLDSASRKPMTPLSKSGGLTISPSPIASVSSALASPNSSALKSWASSSSLTSEGEQSDSDDEVNRSMSMSGKGSAKDSLDSLSPFFSQWKKSGAAAADMMDTLSSKSSPSSKQNNVLKVPMATLLNKGTHQSEKKLSSYVRDLSQSPSSGLGRKKSSLSFDFLITTPRTSDHHQEEFATKFNMTPSRSSTPSSPAQSSKVPSSASSSPMSKSSSSLMRSPSASLLPRLSGTPASAARSLSRMSSSDF